jgi:D-sedoheptulose 7-phosphate isomerase
MVARILPYLYGMKQTYRDTLLAAIEVKQKMLADQYLMAQLDESVRLISATLSAGGRVLLCGNGGSAADAQHIAAELSGRFYIDRPPMDAEALHVNTSYLTAVANDYSYDEVYARAVLAKGRPGDVLVALSTSGNSANVLAAVKTAQQIGMMTIGLTGESGGELKSLCSVCLSVPSSDTPRIQEAHITLGHILCNALEERFFGKKL